MLGDFDARFYVSILLRRLPYFVAAVCIATAIGVMLVHVLPPRYRSSATLLVQPPQIAETLAPSTVPPNAIEQLQIIEQQLLNGPSLLALADRFDIYAGERKLTALEIVDDMRSSAKVEPVYLDTPSGSSGAIAFSVSFDARDPEISFQVVNELVDSILSKNKKLRVEKAGDTLKFFQQEVDRLAATLSAQEGEILDFKNKNRNALPDSLSFRRQQQIDLQERLQQLEREEAALRSRRNNLVQFATSGAPSVDAAAGTPEEQMLDRYRRTLVEQSAVFADSSPALQSLRARIAVLEEKVRAQRLTSTSQNKGKAPPTSMDLQLADIDGQLGFITQEKASIRRSLDGLGRSIAATPDKETVLNALDRKSRNTQVEYNSAVARLATASTGEQIELSAKGERLTLVDPAVKPLKPFSPNRLKIAAASLAGGIGLGLGIVVLLEILNKSIRRPIEIAHALQIETFAAIPYIRTRREILVTRLAMGLPVLLFLAAVPVAIHLIDQHHGLINDFSSRLLFRLGLI